MGKMAVNEVTTTIVGRIASDITVRTSPQGKNWARFTVISQERRFDSENNVWVEGDRLFVSVSCWGWTAVNVQRSLSKGDPVVVMGRVGTHEYESASGEKRVSLDLAARAVGPDLSGCWAVVTRPSREPVAEQPLPLSTPSAA
jgi:single-strand DNA-binding protein